MTSSKTKFAPALVKAFAISAVALTFSGCSSATEEGGHVAGWSLVEASQRHPIVVSQQPANLSLRVARGSQGLNPSQRSTLINFLNKYRGGDTGNAKIEINVPSGTPNEVAALYAVADMRQLMREYGIDETRVSIAPYHTEGDHAPPIRVSYARFVAEGPACGQWPTNLAHEDRNLPYPNFGCSSQRNFAAQVANPADLLGPRTMTPASSDRRDTQWGQYVKGESTIARKNNDERLVIKGQ